MHLFHIFNIETFDAWCHQRTWNFLANRSCRCCFCKQCLLFFSELLSRELVFIRFFPFRPIYCLYNCDLLIFSLLKFYFYKLICVNFTFGLNLQTNELYQLAAVAFCLLLAWVSECLFSCLSKKQMVFLAPWNYFCSVMELLLSFMPIHLSVVLAFIRLSIMISPLTDHGNC